jgi:hypothetical protein
MPPANKKLTAKRADQAKLKQLRRVTITLEASEEILARIAALLTFATLPYELEEAEPIGPLPWEDPDDPRFVAEPQLQIDYNLVKNDIMAAMDKYLTAGGDRQKIVAAIHLAGGETLSTVPQKYLLELLESINRLNQSKDA